LRNNAALGALCSGVALPICIHQKPLDVIAIATLETSWVTMQEAAPVSGYACLAPQLKPPQAEESV